MKGFISILVFAVSLLTIGTTAQAQGQDNTGLSGPMPCPSTQEGGSQACPFYTSPILYPSKPKTSSPSPSPTKLLSLALTVKCTTVSGVESCLGQHVPIVNQYSLPTIGNQACVPASWASVLGTYYNAGFSDSSSYHFNSRSDLSVAQILASLMSTNATNGTSYAAQLSVSQRFIASLSGSSGVAAARLGYGTSTAFTPQRMASNIRTGRYGVMQIGLYDLRASTLLSGRRVVTYARNGGHDVFPHSFSLRNGDYNNGFAVRIMDPTQKVKSDSKIVKYSVLNPTVTSAAFGGQGGFGLSSGASYIFSTTELPPYNGVRMVEGMIYVAPR